MNLFPISSAQEFEEAGCPQPDIILVTADAYVDHPSFANAVLTRYMQSLGYSVAVLPQPDYKNTASFKVYGKPKLCFAVSGGNVDSMINNYTANKRPRSEDSYAPGGKRGLRPDRATTVYTRQIKQVYKDIPVIIGGIEASMRRLAHYDYWSGSVRPSLLIESKADLLVYGMAEHPLKIILEQLKQGKPIASVTNVRGTVYCQSLNGATPKNPAEIPSYEEVSGNFDKFNLAAKIILENTNPKNAKPLIQKHNNCLVIQNPPSPPLTTQELDAVFALPFTRKPHPRYANQKIPAFEMIKDSVIIHRGCFGGCAFCSLTLHQGKIIQPRSHESILKELQTLAADKTFSGIITDLGAPTANMYGMYCKNKEAGKKCKRLSCLYPGICQNLETSHKPVLELMRKALSIKGIKKILINSGIRMDLALLSEEYIKQLAQKHTGGYLSVAPEQVLTEILALMNKPDAKCWLKFNEIFEKASAQSGKEQYTVPYFISAYPGTDLNKAIDTALFLRKHNCQPRQINDFIPAPMEHATAIYYTGKDPFTGKPVYVAKTEKERKLHRALMQYFKPENKPLIMQALKTARRLKDAAILLKPCR